MGNLHKGHISLINYAKKKKDFSIVSIFINPLQFDNTEDLKSYPRTLSCDVNLLKELEVDVIFIPESSFVKTNLSIIKITSLSEKLCGVDRPGHFEGVATIIFKFLNLIKPHKIILGERLDN